jgi:transcriptional regulator with XRE-family HTH domain
VNIRYTKAKDSLADDFAKSIASVESQVEIQKLTIVEELLQFMQREGINRSELAERMGVGPSRITKMLSGDENLTIDTLVRAGRAVGADLVQTFVPKGQKGHWAAGPAAKQSSKKRASLKKTKG